MFVVVGVDQVLGVVVYLYDVYVELFEYFDVVDLVFECVGILEIVEDVGFVLFFGFVDVCGVVYWDYQVVVVVDQFVVGDDIVYCCLEVFLY